MAVTARQQRELVIWTEQQARARQTITGGALRVLLGLWRALRPRDWYSTTATVELALQSSIQVRAAQVAAANSTQAYLRQTYRVLGAPSRPRPLALPELLRPVDPLEQWLRPAEQYRWARSTGLSEDEALARALTRVEQMTDDDIALADDEGARQSLQELVTEPLGYRRVIHPELSKSGVCGLCVAASDRLYRVREHRPFHTHCNCTILPVTANQDPGQLLNQADLNALYGAAGGNTRDKLKAVRFKVQEHSELGPQLRAAGQKFTTAEDRARPAGKSFSTPVTPRDPAPVIAALERSVARMEESVAAGDKSVRPALAAARARLAALRLTAD